MISCIAHLIVTATVCVRLRADNGFLFVASTLRLRYVDVSDPGGGPTVIPVVNLTNAVAIDFDATEQTIYWSDVKEHTISRAKLDGTEQETLFTSVSVVDGLTLDGAARTIYWTDTGSDTIETSNMDGTNRKVVINRDLDEPRAIVLDLLDRWLYWTDWGSEPRIERARLDGAGRTRLVTRDIVYPNGLVLDPERKKLYWADAILDKIEMANLDGTSRRILFSAPGIHPFAIKIIGEHLYWSDWQKAAILRIGKSESNDVPETILSSMTRAMCLKVAHLNSGQNVLLLGGDYEIREIDLDVTYDLGRPIPSLSTVRLPLAMEFDVNKDKLYWSELQNLSIIEAYRNGSGERILAAGGISYPSSLALSRETNELFWVDHRAARIEKIHLVQHKRTVVINSHLLSPWDIALDTNTRYMYWTDIDNNTIDRATYTGADRSSVLAGLASPSVIAIDVPRQRLYWGELQTGTVYAASLDGSSLRRILVGSQVADLAVFGEFLFWIDRVKNFTARINPDTGHDGAVLQSASERFMGLASVQGSPVIDGVWPTFGPVAGGTNLTISGKSLLQPIAVKLGDAHNCILHVTNTTTIIAASPALKLAPAGGRYPIYVLFTATKLTPTGYDFAYKPDPVVTSLEPLTTVIAGGTFVTVSGKNLDAISEPVLNLTRVTQTIDGQSETVVNETVVTGYGSCDVINDSELLCITPNLDTSVVGTANQADALRRRRRDLRGRPQRLADVQARAMRVSHSMRMRRDVKLSVKETVYAGLILDGVMKYRDLSKNRGTKAYGVMRVVEPPTLTGAGGGPMKFSKGQPIDIQGDGLTRIGKDNYKVDVGLGSCQILDIAATVLTCMPPQKEPNPEPHARPHVHAIKVYLGTNIHETVGQLEYPTWSNIYLGIGCGAIFLLAAVVVIFVVQLRRRRAAKKRPSRRAEVGQGANPALAVINLPPVQQEH